MAANLSPLTTQSRTSYNAILVGSRKDWDEYLQKHLGKVTSTPPFLVVIEEIIESLADSGLLDSRKDKIPPTIKGFTPLVLALPVITGPASSSVQEGTAIVPAIRGFDPFILPRPTSEISGVSSSKPLKPFYQVQWSLIRICKLRRALSFACRSCSLIKIAIVSHGNTMCP